MDYSQVLGEIRAGKRSISDLPEEQRAPMAMALLNEVAKAEIGSPVSAALRRAGSLGPEFAVRLASGKTTLTETTKVFITKITEASTKLTFVGSGEVAKRGVRDVPNTGLPKNKPFYLRGIRLRSVKSSGDVTAGDATTKAEAAGLDFDVIDKVLSTGALTIKVGEKEFISRLGCSMFNNKGNSTINPGYYELANPIWIPEEKPIEIFIDESASLAAKTFAWLELIGFDVNDRA